MTRRETRGGAGARIAGIDWRRVRTSLEERGYARLRGLLEPGECRDLERLYDDSAIFRKRIDMASHRFGEGEYQYFAYPLPPLVAELRSGLYPPLARIANAWQKALGSDLRYPPTLPGFLRRCRGQGQERPTPLLLRYAAGGYNRLHQDLYGDVAFPLQVAILLSRPGRDFRGGEFLLLEQRARMQSRGEAIALTRGEGLVFPNRERPIAGARGLQRAQLRHGVSTLHAGRRTALGIIFHDAR